MFGQFSESLVPVILPETVVAIDQRDQKTCYNQTFSALVIPICCHKYKNIS